MPSPPQLIPKQISLVITTYNWPAALDITLESVSRQSEMPAEIIVADDGSDASTSDLVASWTARLPVPLRHVWQENTGFRLNRSRNRAIALARRDYVVLVDGDMLLHKHFIADHAAAAEPGCFVQGTRINTDAQCTRRLLDRSLVEPGLFTRGLRRRHHAIRSPWLARHLSRKAMTLSRVKGCNQGYWRRDLLAVNGFNEEMQGWGPDDKECAARLFNIGIGRKHLPFAALAMHLFHPPSKTLATVKTNQTILDETVAKRRIRCAIGIDSHLAEFAAGIPATALPPWQS